MTTLSKSHPFVLAAQELERLSLRNGPTSEVIDKRKSLKEKYPDLYQEYMKAKEKKDRARHIRDEKEKKRQLAEYGFETVSYYKAKRGANGKKKKIKNS